VCADWWSEKEDQGKQKAHDLQVENVPREYPNVAKGKRGKHNRRSMICHKIGRKKVRWYDHEIYRYTEVWLSSWLAFVACHHTSSSESSSVGVNADLSGLEILGANS